MSTDPSNRRRTPAAKSSRRRLFGLGGVRSAADSKHAEDLKQTAAATLSQVRRAGDSRSASESQAPGSIAKLGSNSKLGGTPVADPLVVLRDVTLRDHHGTRLLDSVNLRLFGKRRIGICATDRRSAMALAGLIAGRVTRFDGCLEHSLQPGGAFKRGPRLLGGRRRLRSNWVLEDYGFQRDLSLADNLFAGSACFFRRTAERRGQLDSGVAELLERFELPTDPSRTSCDSFDRTQRISASICRVLLCPADVYVFTGVTASLSSRLLATLRWQTRMLTGRGATVVMVEDTVDDLYGLSDDQVLLCRGRVAQHGPATLYPIEVQRSLVACTIPRLRQTAALAFRTGYAGLRRVNALLAKTLELAETLAPSQHYCVGYVDVGAQKNVVASLGVPTRVQDRLATVMLERSSQSSSRTVVTLGQLSITVFSATDESGGCCFVAVVRPRTDGDSDSSMDDFDPSDGTAENTAENTAEAALLRVDRATTADSTDSRRISAVAKEAVLALAGQVSQLRSRRAASHNRRLESLGELAGGIAHDINNWLAAIMNHAESLCVENEQPELTEGLESIIGATQSAGSITRKLLAFARRGMSEFKTVSVHDVIHDAMVILSRGIDKRVAIQRRLEANSAMVNGDASELQNVLLNLAINSWQAMRETGGTIRITTANAVLDQPTVVGTVTLPADQYIRITVSDTGSGMPPEYVEKAFEPFFSLRSGETGSGLGLATVKGAVIEHRGAVTLASEVDRGTRVTIWLPLAAANSQPPAEPQAVESGDGTVLICDDEPMVLRSMEKQLRMLGYRVITVRSATECIEAYVQRYAEIDLVLLDFILPDLDGFECFLRLKKVNPNVTAVLVTGYRHGSGVSDLYAAGIAGIIHKPYRMSVLAQQIQTLTRKPD